MISKWLMAVLMMLPFMALLCACSADGLAESTENDNRETGTGERLRSGTSRYEPLGRYSPAETSGAPMDADSVLPEEDNRLDITIQVGTKTYVAKLYDNEAARGFAALLPLSLDMSEHGGNEKYANLNHDFPVNQEQVGTIQEGELMLYGENCVVLFYESFQTSYRYTRLGWIEDPSGLREALGSGHVTVTFQHRD